MRIMPALFILVVLTGVAGSLSGRQAPEAAASPDELLPAVGPYFSYLPHLAGELCGSFSDSFDNQASGWFTGERDSLVAEYLDGEYRMLVTQPMTVWFSVSPSCSRTNYQVETDARWVGTPGNFYALVFDIQNGIDGAYLFAVNTDTRVWLVMQVRGGDLAFIIPETGNDAIRPGGQPNRLAVERRGATMFLSINGIQVGELRAGRPGNPAAAGLVVGTYIGVAPADARFDNFTYANILMSDTATPARFEPARVFNPVGTPALPAHQSFSGGGLSR